MCKARLILACAVLVFYMSGGNRCADKKSEVSEQQRPTPGLDTGLIEKIIGIKGMEKMVSIRLLYRKTIWRCLWKACSSV